MTQTDRTRGARPGNLSCVTADGFENSLPPRLLQARNKLNFETINRAALAALPAVLARLIPGAKILGREYADPTRADRRPGSFKINLRTGRWADFATGDRGGDLVSLVAFLESASQTEAARRLVRMVGIIREDLR